jgi:hypothetical protein
MKRKIDLKQFFAATFRVKDRRIHLVDGRIVSDAPGSRAPAA